MFSKMSMMHHKKKTKTGLVYQIIENFIDYAYNFSAKHDKLNKSNYGWNIWVHHWAQCFYMYLRDKGTRGLFRFWKRQDPHHYHSPLSHSEANLYSEIGSN